VLGIRLYDHHGGFTVCANYHHAVHAPILPTLLLVQLPPRAIDKPPPAPWGFRLPGWSALSPRAGRLSFATVAAV
jgi:hypothetical protein